MKSVFFSILIFAGVFLLAGSGLLSVIGEDWFHYSTYFIFVLVMGCAIYVTLFRPHPVKNNMSETPEENKPQIEQREEEHDKK